MIAVRADRLSLARVMGANAARLNATIRAIEYQGTHYQVALDNGAAADMTASVSDAAFAAAALAIGDTVGVHWADADIHALAPSP